MMPAENLRARLNKAGATMLRFGLCCIFRNEPIRFRSTTAKHLMTMPRVRQLAKLSELCLANGKSLQSALAFCGKKGIGAFRILSPFLPRSTHPDIRYDIADLPEVERIMKQLEETRKFAEKYDIRLSFHPDQFIVLASPHAAVVDSALRELEYQGFLAELLGADVINVHGGGTYGDKEKARRRFVENFSRLSERARSRLTVENDDTGYTVRDLLPLCRELDIPLVYDVHHHRCNPDGLTVQEATDLCLQTWEPTGREPYFHISSPRNAWGSASPRPHADYIDPGDFPACWKGLTATVDVEAKAKELAVLQLMADLGV